MREGKGEKEEKKKRKKREKVKGEGEEGGREREEKRRSYWPCASIRAISRIFQFQIRRSRHTALAPFRVFSGVYTILCAPASCTETRSCLDTCNVERDAFVCARMIVERAHRLGRGGRTRLEIVARKILSFMIATRDFAVHCLHRSSRARARLHPFPDQCERMPAESRPKPMIY